MYGILLSLAIIFAPFQADAYNDVRKPAPVWSRRAMAMHHTFIVLKIMGITPTVKVIPAIKMWDNVPDSKREQCPECDGTFDVIVGDEIWLRNDATRYDMILMIIRFYQLNVNGMPYSMIDSDVAVNERKFIAKRWESSLQTNRERRPIADVP